MKYNVGQMLKYIGPSERGIHNGMLGEVREACQETQLTRIFTGQPYYNMYFPGYYCEECAENHEILIHESVLKPIDDPDADEEITDRELNEELLR